MMKKEKQTEAQETEETAEKNENTNAEETALPERNRKA